MGLWPLFLKRTVVTSEIINGRYEDVSETLKDHPTLITLNPLVIAYEVLEDQPATTYLITDKLKMLFFTTQTQYMARAQHDGDRLTFHVKAGVGVTSTNYWICRRRESPETGVEVIEESHVEAPFFLIFYVTKTMKSSHRNLLARLKVKIENKHKQPIYNNTS